jgi:hypothetical protein
MSPIPGIWASQISGHLWAPTGAYDAIASTTLGSGISTITFTGIPQTYTHLQLRCLLKGTSTSGGYPTGLSMTFNGDTAANYSSHNLKGDGASASAGATANDTALNQTVMIPGNNGSWNNSSLFGVSVVDILDYTNTNKYKTTRGLNGADYNGGGNVLLGSGSWRSTSAVTSITFTCDATYTTQFSTNTSFALYGIR